MGGVSGTGIFVLSLEYVVIIASSFIAAIGVTGELLKLTVEIVSIFHVLSAYNHVLSIL